MRIAFYGSSLLSSYWNGAATYYRGLLKALARRGAEITFCEPDAYDRQKHRDIDPPDWARVIVYPATGEGLRSAWTAASEADVVIKASGVGVFDDELLELLAHQAPAHALKLFWDVDAPATLASVSTDAEHPLRRVLPVIDAVLTYGGGPPVVSAYMALGARRCMTVYNALDPETHFPAPAEDRYRADLSFLGNRLPDREARVEAFFFHPAKAMADRSFVLGGAGWEPERAPPNVRVLGHVPTQDHNAFNCSALAVLNIAREGMAATGYSPATRVFEAAGAGACIITDAWEGIGQFLTPDSEILVARDGRDVAAHLETLTPARAGEIGAAARARVLAQHTYAKRAAQVDALLRAEAALKRLRSVA